MYTTRKQIKFRDQQEEIPPTPTAKESKTQTTTPTETTAPPAPATAATAATSNTSNTTNIEVAKVNVINLYEPEIEIGSGSSLGKYTNWSSQHSALAAQPWCCIGDLMNFCDKYEFKSLSLTDAKAHTHICAEVKALLSGAGPFDWRKRFPGNIRNPENLWVCIGRCTSVEYHLTRILNIFRKPLEKLSTDKQRQARQNFHLAINELRLDISARITEVKLYDRVVFEREFQLNWLELLE